MLSHFLQTNKKQLRKIEENIYEEVNEKSKSIYVETGY
jgi:hypothetical protein